MLRTNIKYIFFTPLLILLITGCSHRVTGNKTLIIYPAPPDTARIQYLTSYNNSLDITGKRSAIQESVLGVDPGITIGKPYGITTVKGKIFVCDAAIKGLEIIDIAKKTFSQFIPGGRGQLKLPINCFVHEDRLYITDVLRNEVVIFDKSFNYVSAFGKSDSVPNFKPMDVCAGGNKIFVTNPVSHQILVYENEEIEGGKLVTEDVVYTSSKSVYRMAKTFPDTIPGGDEYLFNPINISYWNGKVYVTDFGDFKIKIFTEDGEYIGSVGQYGNAFGQFVRPKGTSLDKEGNLFVVDAGFENVQIFNTDGKLLMHFGGPYNGHGDMWLPAKVYVDYDNLDFYKRKVDPEYDLQYLIFVTNQYGPDKVSVYGAIKPKSVGKQ